MTTTYTYPGVYIQEISSGQHIITGVPTSITAFVGRAVMGPTDEPMTVESFADFERYYGGRAANFPMGYAVYDFFLNGGSQAVIARVESASKAPAAATTGAKVLGGTIVAANGGAWGNDLTVSWDNNNITDAVAAQYTQYGLAKTDLFNLTITYQVPGEPAATESFPVVCGKAANPRGVPPNRLDLVLTTQSNYMRVATGSAGPLLPAPTASFTAGKASATGGTDGALLSYTATTAAATPPAAATPTPAPAADAGGAATPAADAGGAATPAADAGGAAAPAADASAAAATPAAATIQPDLPGDEGSRTGIYMLDHVDIFNLLCIPPDTRTSDVPTPVWAAAAEYCADRRAMVIVDPPAAWSASAKTGNYSKIQPTDVGVAGDVGRNAAVYFPKVKEIDPYMGGTTQVVPACGIIAGVYASTDATRGVWKAPAGVDAALVGIDSLEINLTDAHNGDLNQLGINCLRSFPILGPIVWGARTLRGADLLSDDYKYVPVRRLTLYVEESLYRGTKYAVFEPNDEPLWAQLRLSVNGFLGDLARQGAFYNYFVQCDKTTTTADDIARGICNVIVGIAPVKPAEFIVLKIQQVAGQAQS
jgi:uncharacterized protein